MLTNFDAYAASGGKNIAIVEPFTATADTNGQITVQPKIVSEMLGHSHISITLGLYSHVTPHMQQQAPAAMDAALGED